MPLAGLTKGFTDPARSDIFGIPIFVLITIAVVVVGSLLLRSTRFGRQVYAVGSNPEAAAILGIPSGSSCSSRSRCAACWRAWRA